MPEESNVLSPLNIKGVSKFKTKASFIFTAIVWQMLAADPALADITAKDVQVSARAIAFLSTNPRGKQSTAVIFDATNAASKTEAEKLSVLLTESKSTGKITFDTPTLIDVTSLSDMAGISIAFLTTGLSEKFGQISAAATSYKVLTVSTDLGCAQQGQCVLGIQSQPKVQMLISKQASAATGKDFLPTLLMLAKEV